MAKRFKLNLGDIFTIPINENEVGLGQIISFPITKDVFIMIVYNIKYNKELKINLKDIYNNKILFLGYSTDALLYHKDWIIIGNCLNNIENIILPYHKLGTPPNDIYLTNYKSNRIIEINENVFLNLNYKTTYSPIRYENALKAHFGNGEWKSELYDEILYERAIESNKLAQEILSEK